MTSMLEIKQLNLHHSKAASFELKLLLASSHTDFCLIQEPYLLDGVVSGLDPTIGKSFYRVSNEKIRACIFISHNINATLIHECSSADVAAVLVTIESTNSSKKIVVASVYLPYDSVSPPPSKDFLDLVSWSKNRQLPLVIGCDSNSHHILWSSSNINYRGQSLFNYLSTTELEILNKGSEPTFINAVRREVIDISLCSMSIVDFILNWRVTNDILSSDHRCISFNLNLRRPPPKPYRNKRLTNWDSFSLELEIRLGSLGKIRSTNDIEIAASSLTKAINVAFEKSCPLITKQKTRNKPFWCSDLKKLRKTLRKLKNKAKRSNLQIDWNNFLASQKVYKKTLRSARRISWATFCEQINSLSDMTRLSKTLAKNDSCRLDVLRLPDGRLTSSNREIGDLLLSVHFPGCDVINSVVGSQVSYASVNPPDWDLASRIVTLDSLRWSIFSFVPYKTGSSDGVFPAELQRGFPLIGDHLLKLFQACIAFGFVPQSWNKCKVVFIPKAGKSDYTDPKSFRPISLSSTFLKTLERLVDKFIRDRYLSIYPLSNMQHAYRAGKSCETALHELVTRIERSLNNKELTVGTFMDIAGAFDSTSFSTIVDACNNFGIDQTIISWIRYLLRSRVAVVEFNDFSGSVKVTKGCPQGGVLSPLLWLLVIDELLVKLKQSGFVAQSYADDLVVTVSGKHLNILSDLTQCALQIVETWCVEKGLHVNPSKTNLMVFTRRRNIGELTAPSIFGETISSSQFVKHLGVTLDCNLSWRTHLDNIIKKGTAIFWQCRRAFGKSWGLTPKMLMFVYRSMVLPMLSYASVVWWPVVNSKSAVTKLNSLQGMACRAITGAMSSTPILALQTILFLPTLQSFILGTACSAAFRLKCIGAWNTFGQTVGHRLIFNYFNSYIPEVDMVNDRLLPEVDFDIPFLVAYPSRDLWMSQHFQNRLCESLVFFSDGSQSTYGSGFGTYCPTLDVKTSGSLGSYCTVFQAELIALTHCAIEAFKLITSYGNIILCTDSKSVLNSLRNPVTTSKLVKDCKQFISRLCSNANVTVMWVPAHCGIEGNVIADSLAKEGTRLELIGPEPAAPLTLKGVKVVIRNFVNYQAKNVWRGSSTCRITKYFVSEPNLSLTKYALSLKRDQLKILVSILTGHGRFKYHLHRMGLVQDSMCDNCLEEEDDCVHFVCSCPAFDVVRSQFFNCRSLSLGQLASLPWFKLLQFARAAQRICELG